MDYDRNYLDEDLDEEFLDDTIVEEKDFTVETMKVRQTLRFRTFAAAIASSLFFVLRYFDPNLDFNNVNAPIFLVANLLVLLLAGIIYFHDNSVKPIQYKKENTYKGYKVFNSTIDMVSVVSYLSLVFTIANMFFVSLSPITGTSMMPNFDDEDAVLFSHMSSEYERYDVIIVHQNSESAPYLIKRIVGLPGETVSIDNNRMFINDVLLIEEYIDSSVVKTYCTNQTIGTYIDDNHCTFIVGANEYFVLGDNRDGGAASNSGTSIDSRYFGPVNTDSIYGKVIFKFKDYNLIK
jgi:signal peptidase I